MNYDLKPVSSTLFGKKVRSGEWEVWSFKWKLGWCYGSKLPHPCHCAIDDPHLLGFTQRARRFHKERKESGLLSVVCYLFSVKMKMVQLADGSYKLPLSPNSSLLQLPLLYTRGINRPFLGHRPKIFFLPHRTHCKIRKNRSGDILSPQCLCGTMWASYPTVTTKMVRNGTVGYDR